MKTSYKNTFDQAYSLEPSPRIIDRINVRIEHATNVRAQRKAFAYGLFAIGALITLVLTLQYSSTQATHSGFYEYISLFASDSTYMLNNWKTTLITVAESLPMMGIVLTLGTLLISVYAFKKSATYAKESHFHLLARI